MTQVIMTSSSASASPAKKNIQVDRDLRVTQTLVDIKKAADPAKLTYLSGKSMEEVTVLQQEIADLVPVGNITALVLGGLSRLKGRVVPADHAQRDILALMRSIEVLPKAFYSVLVFSPAAMLLAYQKMMALTGKDTQSAFPNGLWQFYLEFSMREDSARHTNETNGFSQMLARYHLSLSQADQLCAWVISIIQLYFQYDALLFTEWHENVYLHLLEQQARKAELADDSVLKNLQKRWRKQKPYRRGQDAGAAETYTQYRQRKFAQFCQAPLNRLPNTQRQQVLQAYEERYQLEALSYQEQMTILATLDPERYKETRRSIPLWQARVAIIWQGAYHLIPACAIDEKGNPLCFDLNNPQQVPVALSVTAKGELHHPHHGLVESRRDGQLVKLGTQVPLGTLQTLPLNQIRHWVWAIIQGQYQSNLAIDHQDLTLLKTDRQDQIKHRKRLSFDLQQNLELLKMAPIIINWDERQADMALSLVRQGRRGIGDHAITLFRTPSSHVFDLSHIFFDGIGGSTLVEVLTNEAISWAAYLSTLPQLSARQPANQVLSPNTNTIQVKPEAAAEACFTHLSAMQRLRKHLVQRNPDIVLTVNDLLVLYRTLFNREYQPAKALRDQVQALSGRQAKLGQEIQSSWRKLPTLNPVLLIPMDATGVSPRDRLYPVTFRNPFPGFLDLFYDTYNALQAYKATPSNSAWTKFNTLRGELLREIYYFGQLMLAHKQLTIEGQNPSIASLKLLGHLPGALQHFLDQIPQKIDIMNEVLKGEEVFSNIGRVARDTSLTRLTSASDDNEAKALVWAFVTDDQDVLHISLRDFRPEITALFENGLTELAHQITQDLTDAFAQKLANFVQKLSEIAEAGVGERA